jgi:hypothetical protein
MRLGILYHMPFWQAADGTLWEGEGSFARYVDSLAPYFDEISLCVPVLPEARGEGTRIRSANVTLAPLPAFDGPAQFYPKLPLMLPRLARWVREIDVLHCRVPSPAAIVAFTFARLSARPVFLLVVGDLRALLPTMPYRGVWRWVWRAYTELEEWGVQRMADRACRHVRQRRGAGALKHAAAHRRSRDQDDARLHHRADRSGGGRTRRTAILDAAARSASACACRCAVPCRSSVCCRCIGPTTRSSSRRFRARASRACCSRR